jgi:uracil-DNA glycosylase
MRWNERQVAMLQEMGIRLWMPPAPLDEPTASETASDAATEASEQLPASAPPAVARPAARVTVTPGSNPASVEPEGATPTLRNQPAGIETMDWQALREAVAGCTACKLCCGRTQTVFGVGHPRAHWMIVGEAPGEQEDLQGEPFVGKSGQLLDNMLRALGLGRRANVPGADRDTMGDPARQVYIANTLKCRPPGNRNPEPDELAQCEPFLVRQIQLVQPRIILAMGRFAVQSLLRSNEPIGRLRGRVHRYQGVPLVVTYHPAYLLRNLEDKARAWDDLCLAADTATAAP